MIKEELQKILEKHLKWLNREEGGERADLCESNLREANLREANLCKTNLRGANLYKADLCKANLCGTNLREANLIVACLSGADLRESDLRESDLRGADLCGTNLREADLRKADLRKADLCKADLRGADLSGANLRGADLRGADLSGCRGLISPIEYMEKNFEKAEDGYICYKIFSNIYATPDYWEIKNGSIISEVVNPYRTVDCACGVNVGTLDWVRENNSSNANIWKCIIEWKWLPGVVVPYNTDGKIRCEKVKLLEVIME